MQKLVKKETVCKKFCAGSVNTDQGMIALITDVDMFKHSQKDNNVLTPIKFLTPNRMSCPLGCIVLATDNKIIENLVANNTPKRVICSCRYKSADNKL